MRARVCYLLLIVIGLGSLALATFCYLRSWLDLPGLVIDGPHTIIVDDVLPGMPLDVQFSIYNRTSRPLHIVGAGYH
jgi:hypothetical protein